MNCLGGISRSPALVVGLLMKHYRMTFDSASSLVSAARPSVKINKGFLHQLTTLEDDLKLITFKEAIQGSGVDKPTKQQEVSVSSRPLQNLFFSPTRLSDFPEEILWLTFLYLDLKDVISITSVSKPFCEIVIAFAAF